MAVLALTLFFAGLEPANFLVTPAELAALEEALPIDVRDRAAFEAGHIPGAAHFDAAQIAATRNEVPGMLKPLGELRELLARAGADPDMRLVVYAGMEEAGDFKDAARTFWMLEHLGFPEVHLLDGGLSAWKAAGKPVATGAPTRGPAEWTPAYPREDRIIAELDVVRHLRDGDAVLVDLRAPEQYAGIERSEHVARGGHIPGAYNLPLADLVTGPHNTLLPLDELQALLAEIAPDPDRQVVVYCNTGREASAGFVAFRRAGYPKVTLYEGSMAEWSRRGGLRAGDALQAAPQP